MTRPTRLMTSRSDEIRELVAVQPRFVPDGEILTIRPPLVDFPEGSPFRAECTLDEIKWPDPATTADVWRDIPNPSWFYPGTIAPLKFDDLYLNNLCPEEVKIDCKPGCPICAAEAARERQAAKTWGETREAVYQAERKMRLNAEFGPAAGTGKTIAAFNELAAKAKIRLTNQRDPADDGDYEILKGDLGIKSRYYSASTAAEVTKTAQVTLDSLSQVMAEYENETARLMASFATLEGTKTAGAFAKIRDMMKGVKLGELSIIAGGRSTGKSTLMRELAEDFLGRRSFSDEIISFTRTEPEPTDDAKPASKMRFWKARPGEDVKIRILPDGASAAVTKDYVDAVAMGFTGTTPMAEGEVCAPYVPDFALESERKRLAAELDAIKREERAERDRERDAFFTAKFDAMAARGWFDIKVSAPPAGLVGAAEC